MNRTSTTLLTLLRTAAGNTTAGAENIIPDDVDWREVLNLSADQGVTAAAFDGFLATYYGNGAVPEAATPLDRPGNETVKYKWFNVRISAEQMYREQLRVLKDLGAFYKSRHVPTMILKGYGLSLYWPVPEHRQAGDVDIYQYGRWMDGDSRLVMDKGISVDARNNHHSVFNFEGQTVENYYDFLKFGPRKSQRPVGERLSAISLQGHEDYQTCMNLPSPDFNALYLIRHFAVRFVRGSLNLKHLLDWGYFVKAEQNYVDWEDAWRIYKRVGCDRFVLCLDEILVRWLGFDRAMFHVPEEYGFEEDAGSGAAGSRSAVAGPGSVYNLAARVLDSILDSDPDRTAPPRPFSFSRFRNRLGNRWKKALV